MSGLFKKTILLLLLICPVFVMADDGYIIKNYNIDIVVNRDNTFDITEEIYTDFYEEKHGIIRTLPIVNEVERLDHSRSSNYAKLSNVSCNMNFEVSKTKYNYEIKIGDADKTLTGDNLITIKYTYDIGKDPLKDADEFYYNIIGTDWSTSIQNANFTIHFPKEGIEEIGFSCGGYGTIGPGCVEWQLKDNKTITGQINRELYIKEGVTIRVTLPEGYFERTEFRSEIIIIWMAILIGFFAISLYIKNKNSVVEVVEFYPPENLTELDCQAILKPSSVDNSTTMSLAFSLANKGYIKIIDEEFGYKMHKIKDYDGSNKEKNVHEGLV